MNDSPTWQIIGPSLGTFIVTDQNDRQLTVKRLLALDRLRLFKAIGPNLSQNSPYLGMAMIALSVVAVEGIPIPTPVTESQIEALIAKLGDIGIAAVAMFLSSSDKPTEQGPDPGN